MVDSVAVGTACDEEALHSSVCRRRYGDSSTDAVICSSNIGLEEGECGELRVRVASRSPSGSGRTRLLVRVDVSARATFLCRTSLRFGPVSRV